MSTRNRLAEVIWPRDGRSTADIDRGIREELDVHVARLVEEQLQAGVPEDEARRRAGEQFGDVERYAAECRQIDLGDRLLVRRVLVAVCAALVATCTYLGWRVWQSEETAKQLRIELAYSAAQLHVSNALATANETWAEQESRAAWVERLVSLRDHMHTAFGVGPELTLLAPDEGLAIVREAWPRIKVQEVKTGLLKAFAFSKALAPRKHPRVLAVLHLGMTDPDPEVRRYASSYVSDFCGAGVASDPDQYQAWYRTHGAMAVDLVLRDAPGERLETGVNEGDQR